jgi:hypothetical protein
MIFITIAVILSISWFQFKTAKISFKCAQHFIIITFMKTKLIIQEPQKL